MTEFNMRRELLVMLDRLKFRAYRKETGNFMFAVHASQIVIGLFVIFGFFYSIVPESHLNTLQKLSEEKEVQVTELQNKIDEDQATLVMLNEAIDGRDQALKMDAVNIEAVIRDDFNFELLREKDEYFDAQFGSITKSIDASAGIDAYVKALNEITLIGFYNSFLRKTQYAYAGLTEVRPVFVDMRQSLLKVLQNPPERFNSDCILQKDASGGGYHLEDVHGVFLQSTEPQRAGLETADFVMARRRCLDEVYDNLHWGWLTDRAGQKGPEGYMTKNGMVLGPLPEKP